MSGRGRGRRRSAWRAAGRHGRARSRRAGPSSWIRRTRRRSSGPRPRPRRRPSPGSRRPPGGSDGLRSATALVRGDAGGGGERGALYFSRSRESGALPIGGGSGDRRRPETGAKVAACAEYSGPMGIFSKIFLFPEMLLVVEKLDQINLVRVPVPCRCAQQKGRMPVRPAAVRALLCLLRAHGALRVLLARVGFAHSCG